MKNIFKSMINPMNLLILLLTLFSTIYWNNSIGVWIFIVGTILYTLGVIQKLNSTSLSDDIISEIKNINYKCDRLSDSLKNSTNREKRDKIRTVLKCKNEIYNIFLKDEDRLQKQRITKQTIQLIMVYIELLENYYSRKEDLENTNIDEISIKISEDQNKLELVDEILEKQQIQETLELNSRILQNYEEEEKDLEGLRSKMYYIESSIMLFKQQIMSDIMSEEYIESAKDVINEAIALNNVFSNRKKQRL